MVGGGETSDCTTAVGCGETSDCNALPGCATNPQHGFFERVDAFAERVEDSSLFLFSPTKLSPVTVSVAASEVVSTVLMVVPPE